MRIPVDTSLTEYRNERTIVRHIGGESRRNRCFRQDPETAGCAAAHNIRNKTGQEMKFARYMRRIHFRMGGVT